MSKLASAVLAFILLLGVQAFAQQAPYVYAPTIGTSPSQVIGSNQARKRLIIFNPNDTAKIAVCPAGPRRDTGGALTCAVNGSGSLTILPYGSVVIGSGTGTAAFPMPSAWNGVASSGGASITIYEFE